MEHDIDAGAYGIAAFAVLQGLLPKILDRNLLSKAELLTILDNIAQAEATRGVGSDSEIDTDAARLLGKLAIAVRHHPQ